MDEETSAAAQPDGGRRQRQPQVEEEEELPLVLLLRRPVIPSFHDLLSRRFRLLKPWESPEPIDRFLAAHAGSVRALLTSGLMEVRSNTIALLPKLELVVTSSVGVDHIDTAECWRRGIAVVNAGNVFSEDAADYAVGLLIDVLRRMSAADCFVRQGLWPMKGEYHPLGYKLGGKRIGIIGLGNIGFNVAKRLEAFGCIIMYHSRKRKPSVAYSYFSNIEALATESDVLVVTCALTKETHHIINRGVMLALGKEGIVINVGRGALIDEKELVMCLKQGQIGGAGLDVFENEPNVPEELLSMDNVVLSHHRAVLTLESLSSLFQIIIDNLEAFFSNKPLLSPVLE